MKLGRRWLGTLALLGGALPPSEALACALCISLTKADTGFFWTALFLMALPIALAGLIGGWVYYAYRKSVGRRHGDAAIPHLMVTEKESGQ